MRMDEFGKAQALDALTGLRATGSTNLWDGLATGLSELRSIVDPSNSTVFLLTDGMPNVEPPRGHIPSFQKLKVRDSTKLISLCDSKRRESLR